MPCRISVAIPTSNRPHDIERCLQSLADVRYPVWDILVVDQSEGNETRAIVDRFQSYMPELRYIRLAGKGGPRSRNYALRTCGGDIVAFLDDDCTVAPDWLAQVNNVFEKRPDAGLVFGTVEAAPHDEKEDYIPAFTVAKERVLRGRLGFLNADGIMGASMYMHRRVVERKVPFDFYCGAGAPFAASDRDIAYRVLATDQVIVLTPNISVIHHGRRSYASGAASRLVRRAPISWGALDMKLLRSGDAAALVIIPIHFMRCLRKIHVGNLFTAQHPSHLAWPIMYLYGLFASFAVPIAGRYRLYGHIEEYDQGNLPENAYDLHCETLYE